MQAKLQELKTRLMEINDLDSANALLSWINKFNMPPGGAAARGRQMATLAQLSHEKLVDAAIGKLLDDLRLTKPASRTIRRGQPDPRHAAQL